jgi:hypothetical protein
VRGVLFVHTVDEPFRKGENAIIADSADCIYSELPWRAGWSIFHERAGVQPRSTGVDYICAIFAVHPVSYPTSRHRKRRIRRVGTPTTVTFRGDKEHFPTEKEAYIYLITKLFDAYPQLLQDNSISLSG